MRVTRRAILISALIGTAAVGAGGYAAASGGGTNEVEAVSSGPRDLPARTGVVDASGSIVGFEDRAAVEKPPDFSGYPGDSQDAFNAWLRTPIPVTRTADPGSELVGYDFHNVGFVDLDSYNDPGFDLDALLFEAQSRQQHDLEQYRGASE
jgi:hypothetical protein